MSRLIYAVSCVYVICTANSLDCNITLKYSYYDYVLHGICTIICSFPVYGSFTFREKSGTTTNNELSESYVYNSSIRSVGSFWGEYLICKLEDHSLICASRIDANATITLHCNGTNGVWPPFEGPFVHDDTSYKDTVTEYLITKQVKIGGKKCVHYESLHMTADNTTEILVSTEIEPSMTLKNKIFLVLSISFVSCLLLCYIRHVHRTNVRQFPVIYNKVSAL